MRIEIRGFPEEVSVSNLRTPQFGVHTVLTEHPGNVDGVVTCDPDSRQESFNMFLETIPSSASSVLLSCPVDQQGVVCQRYVLLHSLAAVVIIDIGSHNGRHYSEYIGKSA